MQNNNDIKIKYFDVLNINEKFDYADIIQTVLGDQCLGANINKKTASLFFNKGMKEKINQDLKFILPRIKDYIFWTEIQKQDWHLDWQQYFQPVKINHDLEVIPYWKNRNKAKITIKIKPGMAFGTGNHETTWLMLSQMINYIKPGSSVLDLGAGSGILSIAAKKLGAEKIDAVEFDQDCQENFLENLKLNKIDQGVNYHNQNVLDWTRLDYDFILANINLKILEKLIPQLINTNSIIILSGILESDINFIKNIILHNNFMIKTTKIKGEWLCMIIQ